MNMLFKVRPQTSATLWHHASADCISKNFLFYGLSNFANPWVARSGPKQIMYVFGGTSLLCALVGIPVYIYGKKLRSWWQRHDLFIILKMETSGPKLEMG